MMTLPLLLVTQLAAQAATLPPRTIAEQSDWKNTGRYDEVLKLCPQFEKSYPGQARCFQFGETPEGRPMMALAVSVDGTLDASAAHQKKRPVVVFQGGIHAGEIDGKDAGFAFLREMLDGKPSELDANDPAFADRAKKILAGTTLVFVPVFNIDGHERFGAWNRPNQVGPEKKGWRVTARNLNLNRDYTKAEAPEMVAMLKLLDEWDPILYVDLHVTDGAEFQHDIAVLVNPSNVGPKALVKEGQGLRHATMDYLTSRGGHPLDFYPDFIKDDEPTTGFERSYGPPRFSDSYWAYRNRLGVLVETHSWKDYKTRCRSMLDTLRVLTSEAAAHAESWRKAAQKADDEGKHRDGQKTALGWEHVGKPTMIDFLGYHYTKAESPVSGRAEITYDPTKNEVWHVPLFEELAPKIEVKAPHAGYIVPAAWAAVIAPKLELHQINFMHLENAHPGAPLEVFRATDISFAKEPFEGHQGLTLKGEWAGEKRDIPAGSLFVPIQQPLSEFAMQLFEPLAGDSFLAWGFFNSAFEKKEYMENYVADQVGREMLKNDAKAREEFEHLLKSDADFAKNPDRRLEFFYRRHPSWDDRYGLYPVYRIDKMFAAELAQ